MKICIILILLGLKSFGSLQDVDGNDMFAQANSLYSAGKYEQAAERYQSILELGYYSTEVYYNLGNSFFKLNQVGPAIYNFEKALQLEPNNSDVLNNLKFANNLRVDTVEKVESNSWKEFVTEMVHLFSIDNWAYMSIMAVLLAVLFFILYHYATTAGKKRIFFILSIVLFLWALICLGAASYSTQQMENNQQAIVYSEETITRTEPKEQAVPSFPIHEGTKVTIIETYEKWAKIEVGNGSQSWMPLNDLRIL